MERYFFIHLFALCLVVAITPSKAQSLDSLQKVVKRADIALSKQRVSEAIEGFQASLKLAQKVFNGDKDKILPYRLKLARAYLFSSPQETIKLLHKTPPLNDSLQLKVYSALGLAYDLVGKNDSSLFFYKESLQATRKLYGNGQRVAKLLGNISGFYARINIDSALFYGKQSLEIFLKNNVGTRLDLARTYTNLGSLYRRMNAFDTANYYLDKSIAQNLSKGKYINPFLALQAYIFKIETDSKSISTLFKADSLVKSLQLTLSKRSDKLRLLRQSKLLFTLALSNLAKRYQENKSVSTLNTLFYFSERSKANILLSRLGSKVLPLDSIQKRLNEKEVLLEYFQTSSALYCFVIHRRFKRLVEVSKASASNVKARVEGFLTAVNTINLREFMIQSPKAYKFFFSKISSLIVGARSVLIIPSEGLFQLPFEAFMSKEPKSYDMQGHRNASYLLKRFSFKYHFSASLAMLRESRSYKTDFAGFVQSRFGNNLDSLPYSEKEVEKVSRFIPKAKVYKNNEATIERLNTLDAKILHIATHGYLNYSTLESGIWLKQSGRDTVLTTKGIMNLSLKNELVVLSGCNTYEGRVIQGEGVSELPTSLKAS